MASDVAVGLTSRIRYTVHQTMQAIRNSEESFGGQLGRKPEFYRMFLEILLNFHFREFLCVMHKPINCLLPPSNADGNAKGLFFSSIGQEVEIWG